MHRVQFWAGLLIACFMITACGGGYSGGSGTSGGQTGTHDAVYVAAGASILTFIFDSSAGTLSAYGTPTAGPPGGLGIKVDQAANFLYASSFNTNSVYGFSINSSTGNLTAVAGSPFPFPGTIPPNRGNGGPLT